MFARAAGEFGVQFGEIVGLGNQVDIDVDAGEVGELLQQRLIGQLVGVRGLQDVDGLAFGLAPVEAAGDLGRAIGCRRVPPTPHADSSGTLAAAAPARPMAASMFRRDICGP